MSTKGFNKHSSLESIEKFLQEHGLSCMRDVDYSVWRDHGDCWMPHWSCATRSDLVHFCNKLRNDPSLSNDRAQTSDQYYDENI